MAPRILIVDDDRELTRMLHAALQVHDRRAQVVELMSAEEAMLELRRHDYDLVVLDVRLPGMDGLEFVRRISKVRPNTRLIVMTGQTAPAIEAEARRLEVSAFFSKPIRTDDFLAAVQQALGGPPAPPGLEMAEPEPRGLADRLSALRQDLGCLAVYLADDDGRVVARAGDVSAFDVGAMLQHAEVALSASLKICQMLGGIVSQNMHFFDGDEHDVYALNVGQNYMLVILYSGDIGDRQMGLVLRYGRQCADDLLHELADALLPAAGPAAPVRVEITIPDTGEEIVAEIPADRLPAGGAPAPEAQPEQPEPELDPAVLDAAASGLEEVDVNAFWDEALDEVESGGARGNALSFEQAAKLGLAPKDE